MSWVTDVLLIFSLEEGFEEDSELELPTAIQNINTWLHNNGKGVLDDLSQHVSSGGKTMQSYVYGGAFNYLDIDQFKKVVEAQLWRAKEKVQLLIKEEQEEIFSMYILEDD